MKAMVIAALLATTGLAQAESRDHVITIGLAEKNGDYSVAAEASEPAPTLNRKKRSVAPTVGMPCEAGYKQVGDDCVLANVEFE